MPHDRRVVRDDRPRAGVEIDVRAPEHGDFFAYVHEVYPEWDTWYADDTPPYARIDPDVMFAYAFEPSVLEGLRGI